MEDDGERVADGYAEEIDAEDCQVSWGGDGVESPWPVDEDGGEMEEEESGEEVGEDVD